MLTLVAEKQYQSFFNYYVSCLILTGSVHLDVLLMFNVILRQPVDTEKFPYCTYCPFCLYGNVIRVRFLRTNLGNATKQGSGDIRQVF